jgi:6-phosphogluconolactonase (cycloisomerase 2 family)
MRSLIRLAGSAAIAATAALAGPAGAAVAHRAPAARGDRALSGARDAVFVQTDGLTGNQVVAYHRSAEGTLTPAGIYPTGGTGGQLVGSVVDHLASQGSLSYDPAHALLYAVNAGSSTVSVFGISGDRLALRQVISSWGSFPVSIAVHGDLVYVLNAENGGSLHGYRVSAGRLAPIPGSGRALGLDPTATPQFTNTPGQVAFSPDGSQLVVTTKANGNDIEVFGVTRGGLTGAPVVNAEPGAVPFGVTFDRAGDLVVAETGPNALATFALHSSGTVTLLSEAPDGQSALCWVAPARGYLFASNAGSGTVSAYAAGRDGQLALAGATATDPGTVDAAASAGGRFLYVQTGGNGVVDEFAVGTHGGLRPVGSVTVPGAVGGEGIVAG